MLDLNTVVTEFETLLHRTIGEDIEILTVLDPALGRLRADPGQIEQVLLNLAVNARDAMPDGGKLTIETANVELDEAYSTQDFVVPPGRYVTLAVTDTGVGMDKETRNRIFEPFFTTKASGAGTGLGLASVYGIVKQSDGHISVHSEPGKGTTFKIYLPRVEAAANRARQEGLIAQSEGGSETILVVEDDEMVRQLVVLLLEKKGYQVLAAEHAEQALQVCQHHEDPIDLLVTDLVMPGRNGVELAEQVRQMVPEAKTLLISGYADKAILRESELDEHMEFLAKPFSGSVLARKVREILDSRSL